MPAPELGGKELTFIEHLSLLVHERGLPRSTGRVLGLLLICEPRHESAETIQQQLKLSVGSVSTALQLLQRLGLVQKRTFPEDRRFYYELTPDCWKKLIASARHQMQRGVDIADEGLVIDRNNDRLTGMRQLYKVSEEMLGKVDL